MLKRIVTYGKKIKFGLKKIGEKLRKPEKGIESR